VYRYWDHQARLYLFLMDEMSKAGERWISLTPDDIQDAVGIFRSDLYKVRRTLQEAKLITVRKDTGVRGGTIYALANPAKDGGPVRKLSYIRDGGLTRDQILKWANVRLKDYNGVRHQNAIVCNCPQCGDAGALSLYLPKDDQTSSGRWECGGKCREQSFRIDQTNDGNIIQLERMLARANRNPRTEQQAAYLIERAIQSDDEDKFDPDEYAPPRMLADVLHTI
jgi:hypothetical protein